MVAVDRFLGDRAGVDRRREIIMSLAIASEPVPFAEDTDGVVRIGKTRITLGTVVSAFLEGATAEEIAQQYPTLSLADVYSVIAC